MGFLLDGLFYGSLALGILLGRFRPPPVRAGLVIQGTILLLVGSLGFLLGMQGLLNAPLLVAESALLALALIAVTASVTELLGKGRRRNPQDQPFRWNTLTLPALILAALAVGYGAGVLFPGTPSAYPMYFEDADLLALLFLVGWDIRLSWDALRRAAVPIASAIIGVAVLVPLVSIVVHVPWNEGAALIGAFGWYSLAGPLIGASLTPTLGLIAFLINFLRENFTMVGAQAIGQFSGAEGIAACGGATSMDTTLFFATRFGGKEAGGIALTTGAVLTLLAPFLLTLLLL